MRIIAGTFRGHVLKAPRGQSTRPTTDRVRESIMDMLESAHGGFEGAVVLDVFAGSGALGFEALSRGAQSAVFCECDKEALRVLRANAKTLKLSLPLVRIMYTDVFKELKLPNEPPFDLVFLDPPYLYKPDKVLNLIAYIQRAGKLASDALIVYEHTKASTCLVDEAISVHGAVCIRRKKYGDSVVDVLQFSAPEGSHKSAVRQSAVFARPDAVGNCGLPDKHEVFGNDICDGGEKD